MQWLSRLLILMRSLFIIPTYLPTYLEAYVQGTVAKLYTIGDIKYVGA